LSPDKSSYAPIPLRTVVQCFEEGEKEGIKGFLAAGIAAAIPDW
jgi:hypothetical protein